jgi:hypothetical protein
MRRALSGIVLALVLGGCAVDAAMRRADTLDRVFEPERFRAPAPAGGPPKDPIPVVAPLPAPGVLPPGWYVPDPPTAPEAPEPPPPPVDPAARLAGLLRQNPWLARFWSELTPAEQTRVTRALARRGAPGVAPAAWDPMGLQERVELLFGPLRAAG